MAQYLGVDTGGTFTDFILFDDESKAMRIHKVLSTPKSPEKAILQGIADLGIDANHLTLIHGSTVATNAILEKKGVRTAYITNKGFADVLTIGRQAREELYNLTPIKKPPFIERKLPRSELAFKRTERAPAAAYCARFIRAEPVTRSTGS